MLRPVTLVTGASAGIGAALAHVFAAKGHEVALLARRGLQLTTLADAIESAGHKRPHILAIDLARVDASTRIEEKCEAAISNRNTWSTMPASACLAPRPISTAANSSP